MSRRPLVALGLLLLFWSEARGESASNPIWANITLDYPWREGLLFEVDLEPKAQDSGADSWRGIDITPAIEFSPNDWIELVGETVFARTKQSNALTSTEVTPRLGFRVHFLINLHTLLPARRRLGRVGIANLSRFEWRNVWYSDDVPSTSETRFRNRAELKVGLNHAEVSLDKTLYFLADYEIFVPLSDDVPKRFATKARFRTGLGHRRDRKWRFEILFIRDGTRQTDEGSFATSATIVDFRLKIFF